MSPYPPDHRPTRLPWLRRSWQAACDMLGPLHPPEPEDVGKPTPKGDGRLKPSAKTWNQDPTPRKTRKRWVRNGEETADQWLTTHRRP